jgi:hypothetical protein
MILRFFKKKKSASSKTPRKRQSKREPLRPMRKKKINVKKKKVLPPLKQTKKPVAHVQPQMQQKILTAEGYKRLMLKQGSYKFSHTTMRRKPNNEKQ